MRVLNLLNEAGAEYQVEVLRNVYSAQQLAEETHTQGCHVLKPVITRVGARVIMAIVPADHRLDLEKLAHVLGGGDYPELVPEQEFPDLFDDADVGAQAPFGELYGMETVMDGSLHNSLHDVLFLYGSHRRAIRMPVTEFVRVASPTLAPISTHI